MKNKKIKSSTSDSGSTTLNTEKTEPIQSEPVKTETTNKTDLENAFAEFENSTSTFKPNQETIQQNSNQTSNSNSSTVNTDNSNVLSIADNFKLRLFLGFCCFLLAGFNTFLFNMFFKGNVSVSQMTLDEAEREELVPYLNTPRIIEFIRKIPAEFLAIAHIEMMFYTKYKQAEKENLKKKLQDETKDSNTKVS